MPRTNNIQLRRGTAASWTSANPVLAAGEPGFETDTRKEKVGDGTTAWNSLNYTVVYGTERVSSNAAARTTLTTSTYTNKTSIATGTLNTSATYRIDFSAVMDSATANRSIAFRIRNTTDATTLYESNPMRASFATERVSVGGFVELTFGTTVARTIQLEFMSVDNATTIGCQYAYLTFYRVA